MLPPLANPHCELGPRTESDAASDTSSSSNVSTAATLVAPSSCPTPMPVSRVRQPNSSTAMFAAPPAWRPLWSPWSHPTTTSISQNRDSHYVAIPTTDQGHPGSDSDSDNEHEYAHTVITRHRLGAKPTLFRFGRTPRRYPLDNTNASGSGSGSGWHTCGLLLLALLLLKSLVLLLLLAAILFTLGPLAHRHHGSTLGDERVAQLEINNVHVHNWTRDAYADPVANVDLSAKMLVAGDTQGGGCHDAWWAKWVKWVDGHVQVGEAQYDIWLENPLQPIDQDLIDKVKHDVESATVGGSETHGRLINKILADIANPHDPPAITPVKIGSAIVPAFRPRLSAMSIEASIQDTSIALDPDLVFKWASPYVNLGSEAPPMKLRLVGSPKVSVGWVGKPVKVVGLAKIDTAASFRADYDWKAEDIRFDPGTLLARNTIKSTAALRTPDNDKDDDDDPPVPTEYLLLFTLTFLNPHPLSLALPLALSTPIYSHDEHSNEPLAHLDGSWLDAPGLVIPPASANARAKMPMTLRIPTSKLPKVFNMLQQYHRGERVSVQVGPGSQMMPSGRLAGVVSKAHGIVSVQKGRGQVAELALDAWVASAGRSIVDRVVEWGQEHLVGGAW